MQRKNICNKFVKTEGDIHDIYEGVSGIIILNYHYHFLSETLHQKKREKKQTFIWFEVENHMKRQEK